MTDNLTPREIRRLRKSFIEEPDYPGANVPAWVGDVLIIASYLAVTGIGAAVGIAIWEWMT